MQANFGKMRPGAAREQGLRVRQPWSFTLSRSGHPSPSRSHAAIQAGTTSLRWTDIALLPPTQDVRDAYAVGSGPGLEANPTNGNQDIVFVPDKNGVRYNVVFVARAGRGTPADCKRVYLQRQAVNWPNDNL